MYLIRLFHDNMTGLVLLNRESSEPFSISNGVKKGCVLAPVLFNLFFTYVLNHASVTLNLKYRLDGLLFDLRRLNVRSKTFELVLETLYANDCALMTHMESDLQLIVYSFAEASLFGLTITLGKTDILFQPASGSSAAPSFITIEGIKLKTLDVNDKEIRIDKASQSLGSLRSRVLNSRKLKVYKAIVHSSLLYGCETWTVYRKHLQLLEYFHIHSLRSILGIRWQDRVTNLEIVDRAETTSIEAMIPKAQLRWTAHVIRMEDS
uniref:Reverse transcriptase domain-containing protein n=1 Tax=Lepisosteus oculatus TaxID=7918 RepID=W5M6N8_LEPOC